MTKTIYRGNEKRLAQLYQTDDIEQGAVIRLMQALKEARPATPAP